MDYSKLYNNPYFYIFLMNKNQKYYETIIEYDFYNLFILQKRMNSNVLRKVTQNNFINIFDDSNVWGKREFFEAILELGEWKESEPFPLQNLVFYMQIKNRDDGDSASYSWQMVTPKGLKQFDFYFSLNVSMLLKHKLHEFEIDLEQLNMSSMVALRALINLIMRDSLEAIPNLWTLLDKLYECFEKKFVDIAPGVYQNVPEFLTHDLAKYFGYTGLDLVHWIGEKILNDSNGGKIFVVNLGIYSLTSYEIEKPKNKKYPIRFLINKNGLIVMDVNDELDQMVGKDRIVFSERFAESEERVFSILRAMMYLSSKQEKNGLTFAERNDIYELLKGFFKKILEK